MGASPSLSAQLTGMRGDSLLERLSQRSSRDREAFIVLQSSLPCLWALRGGGTTPPREGWAPPCFPFCGNARPQAGPLFWSKPATPGTEQLPACSQGPGAWPGRGLGLPVAPLLWLLAARH